MKLGLKADIHLLGLLTSSGEQNHCLNLMPHKLTIDNHGYSDVNSINFRPNCLLCRQVQIGLLLASLAHSKSLPYQK